MIIASIISILFMLGLWTWRGMKLIAHIKLIFVSGNKKVNLIASLRLIRTFIVDILIAILCFQMLGTNSMYAITVTLGVNLASSILLPLLTKLFSMAENSAKKVA